MTREEAIKYLIRPIVSSAGIWEEKQKKLDAYNMAIKALQQEPILDKRYNIVKVGGEPTEIAFFAENLSHTIAELMRRGWTIERIDSHDNPRAWDFKKQAYVSTPEYIIISYKICEAKPESEDKE